MTFREYQRDAYTNLKKHKDTKDEILDYCISLSEEVGELNSLIKHHYYGGEYLDEENVAKEVGDVLWYLNSLCSILNINIDTVAQLNIEKLKFRYDKEFSEDKSMRRFSNELKFNETEVYNKLIDNLKLFKK